jgi:ATP-dependent Clp protease, protease subunit
LIRFFRNCFLNRMHQKVHVRSSKEYNFSLLNGLYQRGILILGSEITSENANILSGALIFFSLADSNSSREFKFLINSPGGSVIDGIAIHDTIDTLPSPVETTAVGVAASMACFILNGGTSRTAFPHAWRQ